MARTPNDDRSDSMNPNNEAYQASLDNHANQLNPLHDAYWSSRAHDDDDSEGSSASFTPLAPMAPLKRVAREPLEFVIEAKLDYSEAQKKHWEDVAKMLTGKG